MAAHECLQYGGAGTPCASEHLDLVFIVPGFCSFEFHASIHVRRTQSVHLLYAMAHALDSKILD